ncbi:MAG: diguanylate cyclase [Devosia sp.]|uniref:GGDEF domain-containing protein n=1 Tax=Devosia sp. TaxID=1871048 RepID=UPI0024C7D70A|nr:sensor domain-containing diguanylate cyclase [Devosia sp.]UYN99862.1 MAG: diguanylate cyclase [Devosia sp.]
MSQTASQNRYLPDTPSGQSAVVGLLVLGACIVGIGTRWFLDLASFWPANALLLGILTQRPAINRPMTWIAATLAFLAADMLAGTPAPALLLLTAANLAGVAVGVMTARAIPYHLVGSHHPASAIVVLVLVSAASGGAALVGAATGPLLFDVPLAESGLLWFSTEFVNYIVVFPLVLAITGPGQDRWRIFSRSSRVAMRQVASLLFLAVSYFAAHLLGGPGAILLLMPGLVWCALRFRPVASTAITLIVTVLLLISGQTGFIALGFDFSSTTETSSFRLGVAMVALMPFIVAGLNQAWRHVHESLRHSANHDLLTGLLNRAAFFDSARSIFADIERRYPVSVLMVDIDHFKAINDTYGHATGDEALVTAANALRGNLREGDVVARIGGEEFAIILPGVNLIGALATAERLRIAVQTRSINSPGNPPLRMTVSIGVAESNEASSLEALMSEADAALYVAKNSGRNRVAVPLAPEPGPPPERRSARLG